MRLVHRSVEFLPLFDKYLSPFRWPIALPRYRKSRRFVSSAPASLAYDVQMFYLHTTFKLRSVKLEIG